MKTLKNKLYALGLVGIGVAATFLLEEDIGVLISMLMYLTMEKRSVQIMTIS